MNTYALRGLHCEKCVQRITAVLRQKFSGFSLMLNPPRLTVGEGAPDLATINGYLAEAGDYSAATVDSAAPPAAPAAASAEPAVAEAWWQTYRPVILIVAYLLLAATLLAGSTAEWMRIFMGGYFIAFSFFKFLNLGGFAMTYARYNLLAMRWPAYGYVYPFIELALGLAYFANIAPLAVNSVVFALSLFAGYGVWQAVRQGKILRCACLGSGFSLPVGRVTLVEDFGMAAMALLALVGGHA